MNPSQPIADRAIVGDPRVVEDERRWDYLRTAHPKVQTATPHGACAQRSGGLP